MQKTCPSPDQLRRLLADQLGAIQENTIGEHVEDCPLCQDSLERLTEAEIGPGRSSSPAIAAWGVAELQVDSDFLAFAEVCSAA